MELFKVNDGLDFHFFVVDEMKDSFPMASYGHDGSMERAYDGVGLTDR